MAVHFWPALTVISLTTSATKRPNSGVSGPALGARMAALMESASTVNLTDRSAIAGWVRRRAAVVADPVNATLSWPSR